MGRPVLSKPVCLSVVVLGGVVACRSEINPAYCVAHADPRCPDAGGTIDTPPGGACFGAGKFKICLDALPSTAVELTGTIDTSDDAPKCAPSQPAGWLEAGQPAACFVIGQTVMITGTSATPRGHRPLVILATDLLDIDDDVLLAAQHDEPLTIPAGFDALACSPFVLLPTNDVGGGGGGAGGSLGTLGGSGGAGNAAATGGGAEPPIGMTVLHGGCPGQSGAIGETAGSIGLGANGGGAIYLVSRSITLGANAMITVSGAGGGAGGHHSGGGGAGSGGMIVLYADTFAVNSGAKLIANGGGGASGGDGGNGMRGEDPSTSNPTSVALGATTPGGHGGNGYAGSVDATSGTAIAAKGGGGGGGGGGFIVANKPVGAMASPAVSVVTF